MQTSANKTCPENDTYLEIEWDNLKSVIAWCKANHRYDDFLVFWRNTKVLAYTQGYDNSDDHPSSLFNRLSWTDWLIPAAEERKDWTTLSELYSEKAWYLALMENYLEARIQFARAWKLRHCQDAYFQITLAVNLVYFYWKQKNYFKTNFWLQQSKLLLETSNLDLERVQRQQVKILNYEGRIYYEQNDLDRAEECFNRVVELTTILQLNRAHYLNQKWLVDIAIKRGVNLNRAEKLLNQCMNMANENKDRSFLAHCKASLAHLKETKGDLAGARKWIKSAYDDFQKLGMSADAKAIEKFVQSANTFENNAQ